MRFRLTETERREIREFSLRSACPHCFFAREGGASCSLEWPNDDQRRWPVDEPDAGGVLPADIHLCKEFELA